jgi:hypothetical protein
MSCCGEPKHAEPVQQGTRSAMGGVVNQQPGPHAMLEKPGFQHSTISTPTPVHAALPQNGQFDIHQPWSHSPSPGPIQSPAPTFNNSAYPAPNHGFSNDPNTRLGMGQFPSSGSPAPINSIPAMPQQKQESSEGRMSVSIDFGE